MGAPGSESGGAACSWHAGSRENLLRSMPWHLCTKINPASGEKMNEEIDERNSKEDRRTRAKIRAGKMGNGESDVDREMKGD